MTIVNLETCPTKQQGNLALSILVSCRTRMLNRNSVDILKAYQKKNCNRIQRGPFEVFHRARTDGINDHVFV